MKTARLNAQNVLNAAVIAAVGAITIACSLLARDYPIPCAVVGAFVGSFAATLRLPVSGVPLPPPTTFINPPDASETGQHWYPTGAYTRNAPHHNEWVDPVGTPTGRQG